MDLLSELTKLRELAETPTALMTKVQKAEIAAICARVAAHLEETKPEIPVTLFEVFGSDERAALLVLYVGLIQGIVNQQ